jgi:hypothetical protein
VLGATLAFGDIQNFLMVLAADNASLYTSHRLLSCVPLGAGNSRVACFAPNSRN